MAQTTTTYSASAVNINWLGHSFTGLGSGDDAIQVERTNPSMTLTIGVQGDGTISQSTDKSATITIRLLSGSATNDFLTAKANASDAGVIASGPMLIEEFGSSSKVTAGRCVIEKIPAFTRGAMANEVEWTFLTTDCAISHGSSDGIA